MTGYRSTEGNGVCHAEGYEINHQAIHIIVRNRIDTHRILDQPDQRIVRAEGGGASLRQM
jgi:hypothetical protein